MSKIILFKEEARSSDVNKLVGIGPNGFYKYKPDGDEQLEFVSFETVDKAVLEAESKWWQLVKLTFVMVALAFIGLLGIGLLGGLYEGNIGGVGAVVFGIAGVIGLLMVPALFIMMFTEPVGTYLTFYVDKKRFQILMPASQWDEFETAITCFLKSAPCELQDPDAICE